MMLETEKSLNVPSASGGPGKWVREVRLRMPQAQRGQNVAFLHLFVQFRPSLDCVPPPMLGRAPLLYSGHRVKSRSLPGDPSTDTPRTNVSSAALASILAKLILKMNHHVPALIFSFFDI